MKLIQQLDSPTHKRGVGLKARFNDRQTAILLLDTDVSGIALSLKAAQKAGLDLLTAVTGKASGIGSGAAQDEFHYLASQVQIGDISFADYPVSVLKSAKEPAFDGIIGADVFSRILITIDFRALALALDPRENIEDPSEDEIADADDPAPGFQRMWRFGDHLTIPTSVNERPARLFLIDSGSTLNLIDTAAALESTSTSESRVTVRDIQGAANQTFAASALR